MLIQLKQQLQEWLRRRRAINRLRRFDDHLLVDIGVEREEIAARVYGRLEAPESKTQPGEKKAAGTMSPRPSSDRVICGV